MIKPQIAITDANTDQTIQREMTDDEYATLVESGWTPGDEPTPEPTPEPTREEETIEE